MQLIVFGPTPLYEDNFFLISSVGIVLKKSRDISSQHSLGCSSTILLKISLILFVFISAKPPNRMLFIISVSGAARTSFHVGKSDFN